MAVKLHQRDRSAGAESEEKRFFADLKKLGWENVSAVKTEQIVRARESTDMSLIDREGELEIQFGIYSFKGLSH